VTAAPVPTLVGERCTLRALRAGDAESLQRHADDPAVALNLFDGFPQPYTAAAAWEWCTALHRQPEFGHVWGIEVGGAIAGCVSVVPQSGPWQCSAVVGYWLGRALWRRGIGSEAIALVTEWTWAELPQIARLWAPIYARNAASQRAAARAGYVQESTLPHSIVKAGEIIDAVVYAAYRPGLAARKG
jgi:RimJ/RimL family protein N-acetyltransferase